MAKRKSSPKIASARTLYIRHTGHSGHLCEFVAKRRMDKVAKLARGARFMCHICGRAAAKASSLCEPVRI